MISDSKNFIFIHIPKCAGSSIQEYLLSYVDYGFIEHNKKGLIKFTDNKYHLKKHSTALATRRAIGTKLWKSYFKFSCVRNPYARFISCYFWALKDRYKLTNEEYERIDKKNIDINYAKVIIEMGFCRSQRRWLQTNGKVNMDYIMRVESLQSDWNNVCKAIGIPRTTIPALNTNKYDIGADYYWDKKLYNLVTDKYKCDLDEFGYKYN